MDKEQGGQYLTILSIFYYVLGGLTALFSCFPIIHLLVGLSMLGVSLVPGLVGGWEGEGAFAVLPFTFAGFLFVAIASAIILGGWAYAVCLVVAGRSLSARRRYVFCIVVAGIACAFPPFGTALGVLTLLLLTQPVVKEMFPTGQLEDDSIQVTRL